MQLRRKEHLTVSIVIREILNTGTPKQGKTHIGCISVYETTGEEVLKVIRAALEKAAADGAGGL